MSLSLPYLFSLDWYTTPLDVIVSITHYLSARDFLYLCIHNDSFNQRVCQDLNSIIWKILYQRDISHHLPSNDIAGHYLNILDKISTMTPNQRLIYGGFNGYEGIVKNALENGAESRVYDNVRNDISTMTPNDRLIYGAERGYEGIVENALVNRADIHARNDSALRSAVVIGDTEIVKLLLDRGADIHAENDWALRGAAVNGRTEMVKILLNHDADVHALDDLALRFAALNGHTETVKVLLAYGATITPEIRAEAERRGNPEIVALLK